MHGGGDEEGAGDGGVLGLGGCGEKEGDVGRGGAEVG